MQKKIIIFGGTGFIGRELVSSLKQDYIITVVSRKYSKLFPDSKDKNIIYSPFADYSNLLSEQDVVINLIGENVIKKPWTEKRKEEIFSSRVDFTEKLVSECKKIGQAKSTSKTKERTNSKAAKKKIVFINASAVGIYPNKNNQKSEALTEVEKNTQDNFLARVVSEWEERANRLNTTSRKSLSFRVINLRLGLVLDRYKPIFSLIYFIHKLGLGGALGSGRDAFSWIALKEIPLIVSEVIKNQAIKGPINLVAPELINQSEFSNQLAKILGRPNWFKVPPFILQLVLGKRASLILNTPYISPEKLINYGYKFKYKNIADLVNQKK